MTADPRATLATLVAALERHLEVASSRRDPDDPSVMAAAQELATAFDDYDEALFQATEVATPLAIYDGPFDDDDDEDDQPDVEVADTGVYSGLEDDDLDYGDDGAPTVESATDDDDEDDEEEDEDDEDDEDDDLDDDLEDEFDDEDDDDDEDEDDDDDEDDDEVSALPHGALTPHANPR